MTRKMDPLYFKNVDIEIMNKLKDSVLRPKFIQQHSVQIKLQKTRQKLYDLVDNEEQLDNIMSVIVDEIIPAGTKGVVRGLEFNHIVKTILETEMEPSEFETSFETTCPAYHTTEIPDWWVHCRSRDKYVIGYNQIDLWNGGSQTNRGNKYLSDDFHNKTPSHVSILCVVCSPLSLKRRSTTKYEMFSNAFLQHRICYTSAIVEVVKKLLL